MSNSKISADLNDIPSLTHLTHLPKFPTNIKHEPFTLNLKQDPSEIIIQSGVYPERNYENNEDINNDLNKPENMLLEIYGLTKNKKENINFDLEDFDGIPENSKENLQFSDGLLKKLEKKALNYQNSLDYLHEEVFYIVLNYFF